MTTFLVSFCIVGLCVPSVLGQYQTYRDPNDYNDLSRPGLSQTAQFARTLGSATGGYPVAPVYPAYGGYGGTYGSSYDSGLVGLNNINGLGGIYAPRARAYYLPQPALEQPYRYRPRYSAYPSYGSYGGSYNAPSAYTYADPGFETEQQPGMLKGAFDGAVRGTLAGAFGI
uniref:Secreted protein n=1 Tax=Panagrellus redivivus TaxID=6233 RepID=A0A7E4VX16_PANRE